MSLTKSGKGWITPVGGNYKFDGGKLKKGKPKLAAGQAKNKKMKAQRLAAAWALRSKPRTSD